MKRKESCIYVVSMHPHYSFTLDMHCFNHSFLLHTTY